MKKTHKVVITDSASEINNYLDNGHWFVVSVTAGQTYKGVPCFCYVLELSEIK